MSLNYPSINHAAGSVVGASGAAVWTAGGVATARSAKGVYTLTLDAPIDATQCAVLITARGAVTSEWSVTQTSDTVKTVSALDNAGAAQDVDFDFHILAAPLSG